MLPQNPFVRIYTLHRNDHGAPVDLYGLQVDSIRLVEPSGPLPVSLDSLGTYLETRDDLHFEWDGSVAWASQDPERKWQVDLQIYDLGNQIQYIEWKGFCPRNEWSEFRNELLRLAGTSSSTKFRLAFHVVQNDVWLNEEGFCELIDHAMEISFKGQTDE